MDEPPEKIFSITLIDAPDKDRISKVVEMLPLLHRVPTKKLLSYSSRTGRVMGFVYVARALAFGNQPGLGAIKAKELYHYLLKHRENLDFDSSIKFFTLVVLISEAAAHGSYMAGDYEEAISISNSVMPMLEQKGDEYRDDQRKLELLRFQALLRLYRLDEAISLFNHSLFDFNLDNLIGADVAINAGRSFVTDLLNLPNKHGLAGTGSITEKSEYLWTKDYSSQKFYLNSIHESYEQANLAEEIVAKVSRDIGKLISLLDEMQMMALSDKAPDIKREQMPEFAYRFQKDLRWLLMGREEGDSRDQNLVNEALSFSHMVLGRLTPDSNELLRAHEFVDVAEKWTVECHDAYGLNDLLWTRALLFEKQQAYDQCVDALEVLVDFTIKHFEATCSTNIKAALIQRYPGIAQKLARHGSATSIFRACELRRGIILHKQRELTDESQFELPLIPNKLGQRTHYLCFSYLADSDEIVVSGYLASGKLLTYKVSFGRQAILAVAAYLDPSKWKGAAFRLRREINPPKEFSGLLEGLRPFYEQGKINKDDHFCIAVDEPINLVPLHYLEFMGETAVRYFSFSRVVSFADARWISRQPLFHYQKGSAFFVPFKNESDVENKRIEFKSLVTQLSDSHCVINCYEDTEATWDVLVREDGAGSLLHLQLHGEFPRVGDKSNPYQSAGLYMARDGCLPERMSDNNVVDWLVTPEMISNDAQMLTGSHITLLACVSGLSKRSQGGDLLGIELMFFMKGAASVVASHWDVKSLEAVAFTKNFYQFWLSDGMSRAQAWRQAMLQSMDRKKLPHESLEQCAFSLFGDWR